MGKRERRGGNENDILASTKTASTTKFGKPYHKVWKAIPKVTHPFLHTSLLSIRFQVGFQLFQGGFHGFLEGREQQNVDYIRRIKN